MRLDSAGIFWEDLPPVREKGSKSQRQRPMPAIPETRWVTPSEFPNLSAAKIIGFDTETKDPDLLEAGPGWARGSGHIIGASLAVEDGTSWYFPIRHETQPEHNLDPGNVLRYLDYTLHDNRPKVGANLIYDLGWCRQEGVRVGGRLYDIQFAEALLNSEAPDVSLEALAQTYLGAGKETSILYDWLARWKGGPADHRQRRHLYASPPCLAGPYAEADASLPLRILEKQWGLLHQRGLLFLFDVECRLIPLLVEMRFKGARVDLEAAQQYYDKLDKQVQQVEVELRELAGQPVNPDATESIRSAFNRIGLKLPTKVNKKGVEKETTSADLLEKIEHPLPKKIIEHRRLTKVRDVFIKSYILEKHVNGRLHCSFHPLRNDETGARSGRFSSSGPNLQNIPVRTEIGREVRRCFVASKTGLWRKFDYSQIEYRMLAHFAVGEGSEELIRTYNENPDVDYHELTGALVLRLTGIELPRRNIKNINFGLIYGMSEFKLGNDLGLTRQQGKELFQNYHRAAPFARATMEQAANEVHRLGYVTTILGRQSQFPYWGPKRSDGERTAVPSYQEAASRWGSLNIERAFTHKALNRRLQGSAADVMKYAMVTAYEAGYFADDACGMPGLTVHDELDFEDEGDPEAPVWADFKRHMETALPGLRVPIHMDMSVGKNWGDAD